MTPEPSERATEPVFVEETIALARIEAIVANARATWLVLLGFLAFITVTLLGVQDVDFFSATATTNLPIVNIAIPTTTFFWTAALLAAVLHTYFHLFLLRLWDALAEAPPRIGKPDEVRLRLGERVRPWLVNDWALRRRPDQAANGRPLERLTDLVITVVIWLATPLVLASFWWRSMTAHDAMLTLTIAGALLVSLFASLQGWRRARARLGAPGVLDAEPRASWVLPPRLWGISTAVAATLVVIGFVRTEVGEIEIGPFRAKALWLAPIDLAGAEIAVKPDDWVGRDTAERRFRVTWCRDRSLPPDACEPPTAPFQKAARAEWCNIRGIEDCGDWFRGIDEIFADEWRETRDEYLANLTKPDLRGRDLRGANLSGAFLAGVTLKGARLEGAKLIGAWLEGTDLIEARLERADLFRVRLEGATLFKARLEGADIRGGRLEKAKLSGARLDGADLFAVRLDGADLLGARLDGAELYAARLDGAGLIGASFQSAEWAGATIGASTVHSANLSDGRYLTQKQLSEAIGNGDTILPFDDETGEQLYVWTCWEKAPLTLDGLLRHWPSSIHEQLRAQWLCPEGVKPERTGRPEAPPADR